MEDKKLDETLFKSFCEGDLQTTKLYEDGSSIFHIMVNALLHQIQCLI